MVGLFQRKIWGFLSLINGTRDVSGPYNATAAEGRDLPLRKKVILYTVTNRVVRLIVRLLHADPLLCCLQPTECVHCDILLS